MKRHIPIFALALAIAWVAWIATRDNRTLGQEKDMPPQSKDEVLIIDPWKNSGLRDPAEFLWAFQAGEVDKATREAAAEVREKLSKHKVGTPKKARGVASVYKSRHGGILAEEGLSVVGLVRIGFKVHDFAEKGDFIWIVRFGTGNGVTQELWISSTTGKVRAVLPPWPN